MTSDSKPSHRLRNSAIVIAAVAVLLVAGVIASVILASEDREGAGAALKGTTVDASSLPVTVPFDVIAGHLVVDADLVGIDEPVKLVVDSGAPTILSTDVADQAGGEVLGHLSTIAIDGSVTQEEVVSVAELSLGGATFTDVGSVKGFLGPDNPLSCISPNGLIGASLMKEAVWQFDYGAEQMTIAATVDGLDHIEGAIAVGFSAASPISPSPLLTFSSGDEALTFLLDTGSDGSLTINPADLAGIGTAVDVAGPALSLQAAGAAGSFDARLLYDDVDLALGDQQLDGFPVATFESLEAGQGNIGNAFLLNYVVTIDWPEQRIYFDPRTDDSNPPLPPAARIGWDGQNIIVGSVVEGSDVAEAGLQVGQRIISIDGQDLSSATRDDFCELYVAPTSEEFELTLESGQTHAISLVEDFFAPLSAD
jgi:predicted aspartyl protease